MEMGVSKGAVNHLIVEEDALLLHRTKIALILVVGVCLGALVGRFTAPKNTITPGESSELLQKNQDMALAGKMSDWYQDRGRMIRFRDIYETACAVRRFRLQILGDDHELSFLWIMALFMTESDFIPTAESPVGAKGVAQVLSFEFLTEVDGVKDPFDINCSVYAGIQILKTKYKIFGSLKDALVGYNSMLYDEKGNVDYKFYFKVERNYNILATMMPVGT